MSNTSSSKQLILFWYHLEETSAETALQSILTSKLIAEILLSVRFHLNFTVSKSDGRRTSATARV